MKHIVDHGQESLVVLHLKEETNPAPEVGDKITDGRRTVMWNLASRAEFLNLDLLERGVAITPQILFISFLCFLSYVTCPHPGHHCGEVDCW